MINRREFMVVGLGGALVASGCSSNCWGNAPSTAGTGGAPQASGAGLISLSVKLTGLCGLVRTGTPFGLDVLMIDGDATLHQTHNPRLWIDPKYLDAPGTTAATQSFTDGDGNTLNYWDLKGYQVTLASSGSQRVDQVTGRRPPTDKLPTTTNEEADVSWMPELKKLTPTGRARLNPQCLFPDPRPAKVASRVRFNAGVLASRFNRGRIDFSKITFNFTPAPSTPFEQALGEAELTDQLATNRVTFILQPFSGPGGSKQIVLKAAGGGAGPVEVVLRNSFDHQCATDDDVRKLMHFSAYDDLLIPEDQPPMTARPIPVASGTNLPNCPHEDEYIRCPHGGYEDVP